MDDFVEFFTSLEKIGIINYENNINIQALYKVYM